MEKHYRSCYIVDVQVGETGVVLTDSQRIRYHIASGDVEPGEFKKWFEKFLQGVSQTLTVFEYVDRGEGPDIELHVTKFFNVERTVRVDG